LREVQRIRCGRGLAVRRLPGRLAESRFVGHAGKDLTFEDGRGRGRVAASSAEGTRDTGWLGELHRDGKGGRLRIAARGRPLGGHIRDEGGANVLLRGPWLRAPG